MHRKIFLNAAPSSRLIKTHTQNSCVRGSSKHTYFLARIGRAAGERPQGFPWKEIGRVFDNGQRIFLRLPPGTSAGVRGCRPGESFKDSKVREQRW